MKRSDAITIIGADAAKWTDEEICNYFKDDPWEVDHLAFLEGLFTANPTFLTSRIIWLHCQDYNLKVHQAVQTKFLEGVRKQVVKKKSRISRLLETQMKDSIQLLEIEAEIAKQKEAGKKDFADTAYEVLAKNASKLRGHGKIKGGSPTIKKRHDRLKKKYRK